MNVKDLKKAAGYDVSPADRRLDEAGHIGFEHSLNTYENLGAWQKRAAVIKKRVAVCGGLEPPVDKCPLNARIFDRMAMDGFTVEKCIFESFPSFYVTGNLYRPDWEGIKPGILNPHGHWRNGRLERAELGDIPLRCANLAKIGFVAFSYDMVGYLDSLQLDHRFGGYEEVLWNIGPFQLQLWNSIRALDFLLSLRDVDGERIGCTGASGGGTQTFFLCAADERVKAAAPVNMISAHYQGGCKCENAPGLRFGVNNVEVASLFAPKPMLITGCTGDWTKNVPNTEYPAIKHIYELHGAGENVEYFYCDAEHNYNQRTREAMYRFFNKVFLGKDEAVPEIFTNLPETPYLRLYPRGGEDEGLPGNLPKDDKVVKVIKNAKSAAAEKMNAAGDAARVTDIMSVLLGINDDEISGEEMYFNETDEWTERRIFLSTAARGERIPVLRVTPKSDIKGVLIAFGENGTRRLLDKKKTAAWLADWLKNGYELAFADLFLTGAYHKPYAKAGRRYTAPEGGAPGNYAFFTCYNLTDDEERAGDVVKVYKYIKSTADKDVYVAGFGKAGLYLGAALPFIGAREAFIGVDNFPDDEKGYLKDFFVPSILCAGGIEACLNASATETVREFTGPRP